MKTALLKWDVRIQTLLVIVNVLFTCLPCCWFWLLCMQLAVGIYQLTSSFFHVWLGHKSAGYSGYRKAHLFGSTGYLCCLGVFVALIAPRAQVPAEMTFFLFIGIPQGVLYAYFWLCRSELHYLEHREFFIFK